MSTPTNEIKCTDRQLAIFGLALRELNNEDQPIIARLKLLHVKYDDLAGVAVGKIWKLILEGNYTTKTLKMQIDRMWPTQIEAHASLLSKAIKMTAHVNTEWGINAVNIDYEVKSFHKIMAKFSEEYNKIGNMKITDDEQHERFKKLCREFVPKLNEIYTDKKPIQKSFWTKLREE